MSDTRVVLVKPGDLLLIGNIGTLYDGPEAPDLTALDGLKQALGLAGIVVFEGDIDLAAVAQRRTIELIDYTDSTTSPGITDSG